MPLEKLVQEFQEKYKRPASVMVDDGTGGAFVTQYTEEFVEWVVSRSTVIETEKSIAVTLAATKFLKEYVEAIKKKGAHPAKEWDVHKTSVYDIMFGCAMFQLKLEIVDDEEYMITLAEDTETK